MATSMAVPKAVLDLPHSHVLTSPYLSEEDKPALSKLRPSSWEEFIGHDDKVLVLRRLLDAAQARGEQPDHIVFHGPPGTGKTALAELSMMEFERATTVSPEDLRSDAGVMSSLWAMEKGQALFIDELHGLSPAAAEIVMQGMEQTGVFRHNLSRLPAFTLIGCTTKLGLLEQPLRDRFGLTIYMDFYQSCQDVKPHDKHDESCAGNDLNQIVRIAGNKLSMDLPLFSIAEVAQRSRGTPRVAGRLLRRVRDVSDSPSPELVAKTLAELGVDQFGLEDADRRYMMMMALRYSGGPVGIRTLAATLGDTEETLTESLEPYLVRAGFLEITPRGRKLSVAGLRYTGAVAKSLGVGA